jgi:hypothetical protein
VAPRGLLDKTRIAAKIGSLPSRCPPPSERSSP